MGCGALISKPRPLTEDEQALVKAAYEFRTRVVNEVQRERRAAQSRELAKTDKLLGLDTICYCPPSRPRPTNPTRRGVAEYCSSILSQYSTVLLLPYLSILSQYSYSTLKSTPLRRQPPFVLYGLLVPIL